MAGYIGTQAVSVNTTSATISDDLAVGDDATVAGDATVTGVITGSTVEATGDTAAGDNAAMGYTSAEGLILTGQGSTSDITLKNDADAVVFTIPTGTDDILFPDNAKAMFGAGSDLQIYHDGGGSYVANSTGILRLQGKSGENSISLHPDAQVELYYNNAVKLATSSTGIAVTGAISASSGNVTITDGDLQVAAGHGINFTTGGAGGRVNNLFDDYEEGTWTPSILAGGTSISYNVQSGKYTKIGRIVTAEFWMQATITGNAEQIQVQGLPYNVRAENYSRGAGTLGFQNLAAGTVPHMYGAQGAATFSLYKNGNESFIIANGTTVSAHYLIGVFIYPTAT